MICPTLQGAAGIENIFKDGENASTSSNWVGFE